MRCPFPGMDPYIERPAIWPDFHDRFIPIISVALLPALRPKYSALVQDRLYVVPSQRSIYPDVAVVGTGSRRGKASASAVLEVDKPTVIERMPEEIRQPYIEIIEPGAGNRLITAIEVLSPDNKTPGSGRKLYLKKRKEMWASGANIIEIDLLRAGKPTFELVSEELVKLEPWRYMVSVERRPNRQEFYAIPLAKRLPCIAVPLTPDDDDVPLDLQAAFTRCWLEGPYPEMLRYEGSPPGRMTPDEIAWCERQLHKAKVR